MRQHGSVLPFVFGASVTAAFFLGAGMSGPQGVPEVVRAKNLEVVNDKGEVVIKLTSSSDASGWVELCNSKGDAVMALGCSFDRAGSMGLFKSGKNIMHIGEGDAGGGSITTYTDEEKEMVCVGAGSIDGKIVCGTLRVSSVKTKAYFLSSFSEDEYPTLYAHGPEGKAFSAWPPMPRTKSK